MTDRFGSLADVLGFAERAALAGVILIHPSKEILQRSVPLGRSTNF